MIYRKENFQPDRKVHPVIGVLLLFISGVLLILTGPLGFLYGIGHALVAKGLKGLGEYFLKIAVSIDQLGNVIMQYLLNVLWIKKGGYPFGNRDETISSALGRNRRLGTLTVLGRGIDAFLDRIDPQHSLNSIDYYTEPSEAVTDRVAWIHIEDNKLLFLKEKEHPAYVLPGGQRLAGASDAIQLCEYLEQLFGVLADPEGVEYIGTFESKDAVPAILLRQRCYTLPVSGSWHPADRIEALHWFGYADRSTLSANNQQVLEALRKKGLIG